MVEERESTTAGDPTPASEDAHTLARAETTEDAKEQEWQAARRLLLVALPDEVVALPADRVLEVLAARPYARIPGAPAAVAGVVNRRGRMLTVVDLGIALGGRGAAGDDEHRVVVVSSGRKEIGLAVRDVLQFAADWWSDTEVEVGPDPAEQDAGAEGPDGRAELSGEDQLRVIEVETVLVPLFGGEDGVGEPTEGRS